MTDKARPLDNPVHAEKYAHGYDSALTLKWHASRTADKQAGWFLPYLQPGMTLLDCGCGSGSITIGLAKAVDPGQIIGIDISEIEIERARARAAQTGNRNVRFEVNNIYQLHFPDNSFDAIFSHNVLEHVRQPDRALREILRVLKPGGVVGIRNTDMGGRLVAPANELIERAIAIYEADWEATGGHPRLGRHLKGLLTEAGFINVAASASYETYADSESLRLASQAGASRVTEADFVERVLAHGLADADELRAMREALLAWAELPGAFYAVAHGEVVAQKP